MSNYAKKQKLLHGNRFWTRNENRGKKALKNTESYKSLTKLANGGEKGRQKSFFNYKNKDKNGFALYFAVWIC